MGEPEASIFQHPGEDDTNHARSGVLSQRLEQRIDVVRPIEAVRQQIKHRTRPDHQKTLRLAQLTCRALQPLLCPRHDNPHARQSRENLLAKN